MSVREMTTGGRKETPVPLYSVSPAYVLVLKIICDGKNNGAVVDVLAVVANSMRLSYPGMQCSYEDYFMIFS